MQKSDRGYLSPYSRKTDFKNLFSEAPRIKAEEGVFIRLIVDSEYMFVTGSKVPQLAAAGVDFIHDKTTGIFHHKVAIGSG